MTHTAEERGRVRTFPKGWSPILAATGTALVIFSGSALVHFITSGGLDRPRKGNALILLPIALGMVFATTFLPWLRRRPGVQTSDDGLVIGEESWPWCRVKAIRILRSRGPFARHVLALGILVEEPNEAVWEVRSIGRLSMPLSWFESSLRKSRKSPPFTVTDSAPAPGRWAPRGRLVGAVPVMALCAVPVGLGTWGMCYWLGQTPLDLPVLTALAGMILLGLIAAYASLRTKLRAFEPVRYSLEQGVLRARTEEGELLIPLADVVCAGRARRDDISVAIRGRGELSLSTRGLGIDADDLLAALSPD